MKFIDPRDPFLAWGVTVRIRRTHLVLLVALAAGCEGTLRGGSVDAGRGGNGGGGNGGGGGSGGVGGGGGSGSSCRSGSTFGGAGSPWKNPVLQCAWSPPGRNVRATPVVIDLDGDRKPEILFVSGATSGDTNFGTTDTKLHAIRGADCSEVWSVPTQMWGEGDIAAGDLDGDGKPEIVGFYKTKGSSGLVVVVHGPGGAFLAASDPVTDPAVGTLDPASGVALADVDGNGRPEIVLGALVFRFEPGPPAKVSVLWAERAPRAVFGSLSLIADVDLDGKPDLVHGNRIFEASTGKDKTPAALSAMPLSGFSAVAQFDPSTPEPEIAFVTLKSVSVVRPSTGAAVFGPIETAGWGGPPTVADFNGDGSREIGVASRAEYRVYSPACAAVPMPADCQAPGILWKSETQDGSGATGSTVFDFNNDCAAEVVYRDECWLRIYDGATGEVRAAYTITSGTGLEEPTVADVDGDGHAEIVVSADDTGYGPGGTRCPETAEAHNGAPWTGATRGIFVLRDPDRRWAPARRVWNQNTYHVTNVEEDGTVPAVEKNSWEVHNNYRQNVRP